MLRSHKYTQMDNKVGDYPDLKDPQKAIIARNYRMIMRLRMMWKILTAQIREDTYYSPECREQKACHEGTSGTSDLLYSGQHILKERKPRRKNVALAWVDNKTARDKSRKPGWLRQNVKDIWQSHEFNGSHEKLKSGIDSWKIKVSWAENLKRYTFTGFVVLTKPSNSLLLPPHNKKKRKLFYIF